MCYKIIIWLLFLLTFLSTNRPVCHSCFMYSNCLPYHVFPSLFRRICPALFGTPECYLLIKYCSFSYRLSANYPYIILHIVFLFVGSFCRQFVSACMHAITCLRMHVCMYVFCFLFCLLINQSIKSCLQN